jgi:hypothetical protein
MKSSGRRFFLLLPDTYWMEKEHNLGGDDLSEVARATIEYLMLHDPIVVVNFPEDDPPSEDIRRLLVPYLEGISEELGELVSRYLTESLAPRLGISEMASQKWTIVVRRKQLSENTLELVVEAPTLEAAKKAALDAGLKANAGDLGWQLYDYDWAPGEPPTLDSHAEVGTDAVSDLVADAEGNIIMERAEPPASYHQRLPSARIVKDDD